MICSRRKLGEKQVLWSYVEKWKKFGNFTIYYAKYRKNVKFRQKCQFFLRILLKRFAHRLKMGYNVSSVVGLHNNLGGENYDDYRRSYQNCQEG